MSFSIEFKDPVPAHPSQQPDTFYPGQAIRGTLVFTIPKQRTLNSIVLSLRAKLETNYIETRSSTGAGLTHGPRRPMREVIRLFEDPRVLFQGPYSVPAQTFKWDFEFVVPRGTHIDRSGSMSGKRGGSKGFIDDGYGELPPSFDWHDRTFVHDASAKVKYKLVARAESSGLFGNDEKEWPIQIRRVSNAPDPQLLTFRKNFHAVGWSSHKLRPGGEKLSVRQRLRSVVSSDSGPDLPSINFQAWIDMPRCFTTQQKFAVEFGLLYEKKGDLDPEMPELVLESVKLALKARTQIMIKRGGFVGMTLTGDRQCEGRYLVAEQTLKPGKDGKGVTLPLDGGSVHIGEMSIDEWSGEDGIELMGDFVTWIIKYGYWISVESVIKHRETGKIFNLDTGFMLHLRNEYVPALASEDHEHAGEDLPGYEDDVQPPEHEDGKPIQAEDSGNRGEKSGDIG